jgi:hypothetical protein
MDPTVQVAMIVAVAGLLGPLLLALITNASHRRDKKQDYQRQDAVAAQAATAARLLKEQQERLADRVAVVSTNLRNSDQKVADTAAAAAETAQITNKKLDVIHTLVNSQMTAAKQAQFEAVTRELAMMREVIALHQAAGRSPSIETLATIKATEEMVAELQAELADRHGSH